MRLYAITDRRLLPGAHQPGVLTETERDGLLRLAGEWAATGVEFVQLREKDLGGDALRDLATALAAVLRSPRDVRPPRLILNAGARDAWEVARTSRADGLHLPGKWTPEQVGEARVRDLVSVGCHSVEEVAVAAATGADLALLSPVFPTESHPDARPLGLETLSRAAQAAGDMPVFALGGVTAQNARSCIEAGAAGIAGIRTFLRGAWKPGPGAASSGLMMS
jgi:thiamine-phosphate pyrophosphorylase